MATPVQEVGPGAIGHSAQTVITRHLEASNVGLVGPGLGRDRSTWHELERRIFEDLVSRDNRYIAHREEWSKVLADLKRMSLDKDDPAEIARFLREKQAELSEA